MDRIPPVSAPLTFTHIGIFVPFGGLALGTFVRILPIGLPLMVTMFTGMCEDFIAMPAYAPAGRALDRIPLSARCPGISAYRTVQSPNCHTG